MDKKFRKLINPIQESDLLMTNLETLKHSFKGYPENSNQGNSMTNGLEIAGVAKASYQSLKQKLK